MIKILNITEEGRGGGALNRIVDIAIALQDMVDFHIICPRGASRFSEELTSKQIPYTAIRLHYLTKKIGGALLYIIGFIPEVITLCRQIKTHKPDIVYVNGSWQIKGVIAAYLCKTWSVWHMNDMYQPKPIQYLFRCIAPLASSFVYASERTKSYYLGLSKRIASKQSIVIPAPIDTKRFQFNPSASKSLVPMDGYTVITVGYINANKGLETLINAAAILNKKKEVRDINFVVVGPVLDSQRGYKARLDKLIQQHGLTNIYFAGFQNNTEKWLAQSDLYLCASRYESSPIALWEALACGKPIVSTDVGDVKNIVDQYQCGTVVAPENAYAMAEAIQHAIANNEKNPGLAKRSRRAASENFSLSIVAQQHLSFYNQIVDRL